MVSVWMTHGDLATYILNNPDANRNPWCIQVATGVLYLHTNETVHGDLKACNILLSNDLVAKISDFDSSLASDNSMTFSATGELRNTLRWTAPELLNDSEDDEVNTIQKTKESDIYALAMTLLEIKTGRCPYAEYRDNNRVLRALLEKRLPKCPKEIYEFGDGRSLWDLLISCWNHNPTARPGAQSVLQLLKLEIEPPEDEGPTIFGSHLSLQQIFNILVNLGSVDLSSKIDPRQNFAMISEGRFGDVWKGKLLNGSDIAVKTWRANLIGQLDHKNLKSAFCEFFKWSRLKHPNIHSAMGLILFQQLEDHLGIVSHWMHGGDLGVFMRKNPVIDRHQKCIEVTSGLECAHRNGLVHGDVKAANVLVSADGIAKLTGFDSPRLLYGEDRNAFSLRWVAPEIFEVDEPRITKQTDIYALGMTMLEIFTGEVPFSDRRTDMAVMSAVLRGTPPTRPTNLPENGERSSKMWQLMLSCWDRDPVARPTATEVLDSVR
ncbi:unnamed protein product [Rhizoctonia solani]|nr:unnamed protein product [Rhizoctonia solani]